MSIRPGATQLTVIPFGPSSRASDFAQPVTAGRIVFESESCGTGSFTATEVMQTMRPAALCSRYGRQSLIRRTAGSRSSSKASSRRSSLISAAGPGGRPARVPDDDVDAAERLHGEVDEPLEVGDVRHVAADSERADPVGLLLELLAAAGEHRDVCALFGECLCRCEPEPGRGAADDRSPSLEAEIHSPGR